MLDCCAELAEALLSSRRGAPQRDDVVRRVARQRGLEIFSAGTHPFARWYDQEVSEGERYATLIERTQWWGRHMLIFGVHVHVGVDSVGKVLPILNGLLRWFPHLAGAPSQHRRLAALDGQHLDRRQAGQAQQRGNFIGTGPHLRAGVRIRRYRGDLDELLEIGEDERQNPPEG